MKYVHEMVRRKGCSSKQKNPWLSWDEIYYHISLVWQ